MSLKLKKLMKENVELSFVPTSIIVIEDAKSSKSSLM